MLRHPGTAGQAADVVFPEAGGKICHWCSRRLSSGGPYDDYGNCDGNRDGNCDNYDNALSPGANAISSGSNGTSAATVVVSARRRRPRRGRGCSNRSTRSPSSR